MAQNQIYKFKIVKSNKNIGNKIKKIIYNIKFVDLNIVYNIFYQF